MRTRNVVRVIKTACGKTISYLQTEGQNKMHSTEGPAIIYAEEDSKAPEYYLYGIKYTKAEWREVLLQHKVFSTVESPFDTEY